MIRRLLAFALLAMVLSTMSCGGDGDDHIDGCPDVGACRLPQTSEDNVLQNFQVAYRTRQIDEYAKLLAADFQFYLDPVTATQLGIGSWTRTQDSLATERLFILPEVTKVVIELDWRPRSAVNAGLPPPREKWTKLFISETYLDVDFTPAGQDTNTITFRVENQQQRFFFRRGRTNPPSGPADTLVYIVEWHDQGVSGGLRAPKTLVTNATWSSIKTRFGTTN